MRKVTLALVMGILTLAMTCTGFASLGQFSGKWKNIDPNTRGITTLDIGVTGTRVTVQAWGKCHPQDCDWGRVNAYAYAPNVSSDLVNTAKALSAVFRTNISQTLMIIHPVSGNRLQAEVLRHFTDNSGRTDYSAVYTFALAEDCVSFNPDTATVAYIGERWKIVDGSHLMFDFGNNLSSTALAVNIYGDIAAVQC